MECVGSASSKEQPQSLLDDALTGGYGRILIMITDDDKIVRDSSCSILEEPGCDGTKALDVCRKAKKAKTF